MMNNRLLSHRYHRTLCVLLLALGTGVLTNCDPGSGSVVIGVTSDFRAGVDLDVLEVEMRVNGQLIEAQELSLALVDFPTEFAFEQVSGGDQLAINLRGYQMGELRVARHFQTEAVARQALLYRLHLEFECKIYDDTPDDPQPSAPLCNETTETCMTGSCQASYVNSLNLEPYTESWSAQFGDICKPLGADPPIVTVGRGQTDYLPIDDYEIADVEAGPQGGHHIWVAARVKNLHQSGSITTIGGEIPELGLSITPLKVIFTMDPDEGSYCKLYGLRFQLDIDGGDIATMLGKTLKVQVSIKDVSGDEGTGERWVTLSDQLI